MLRRKKKAQIKCQTKSRLTILNQFAREIENYMWFPLIFSCIDAENYEEQPLNYQPTPRWGHSAASINGKLYIWGGCMENLPKVHSSTEKTQMLSAVEVFDPQTLLWERKPTTGNPPLGTYWNAYTTQGKYLYTFGGYCGHGKMLPQLCPPTGCEQLTVEGTSCCQPW